MIFIALILTAVYWSLVFAHYQLIRAAPPSARGRMETSVAVFYATIATIFTWAVYGIYHAIS